MKTVTQINIKTECAECGHDFHIVNVPDGRTYAQAVRDYFERNDFDPEQHPYEIVKVREYQVPTA